MAEREQKKQLLEIVQIGMVVRNIEATIEKLNALWEIGPFEIRETEIPDALVRGKKTHVKARLAFAKAGPVELELIEPREGSDDIYGEFLRRKGEGVHHLKIPSRNFAGDLAFLQGRGVGVLQSADTERVNYAYLDTEPIAGVIFELLQRKYE